MGGGFASVSLAGGRIYTTGNQADGQAVICLNAADGKVALDETHHRRRSQARPRRLPLHAQPRRRAAVCHRVQRQDRLPQDGRRQRSLVEGLSDRVERENDAELGLFRVAAGRWGLGCFARPASSDAMMVALDKLTGKEIWQASVPSQLGASKAIATDGAAIRRS